MKRFLSLLLISVTAFNSAITYGQQLPWDDKTVIKEYIAKNAPGTSQEAIDKIFANQTYTTQLQECGKKIRAINDLKKLQRIQNLSEMIDEFAAKYAALRNSYFPGFSLQEYGTLHSLSVVPEFMEQKQLEPALRTPDVMGVEVSSHNRMMEKYVKERLIGLTPGNAFSSVAVQYPELLDLLKESMKGSSEAERLLKMDQNYSLAKSNETVTSDERLRLWLDINFYRRMQNDAIKKIDNDLLPPLIKDATQCVELLTSKIGTDIPKYTMHIQIKDLDTQEPLPNVKIQFPDGKVKYTDADGRYDYQCSVYDQPVTVTMSREGYKTDESRLEPGTKDMGTGLRKINGPGSSKWDGTYVNRMGDKLIMNGDAATYLYAPYFYKITGFWTIRQWTNSGNQARGIWVETYKRDDGTLITRRGTVIAEFSQTEPALFFYLTEDEPTPGAKSSFAFYKRQ